MAKVGMADASYLQFRRVKAVGKNLFLCAGISSACQRKVQVQIPFIFIAQSPGQRNYRTQKHVLVMIATYAKIQYCTDEAAVE